jgi:hypothetical protein
MSNLTLSFISNYNERVEPIMNGAVKPEGIEIIPTYSHPSETFWRQLKFQEFHIAEMSMSSYLIARSGGADMIALPVFPSRRFFHAEQSYHVDSGIKEPGDITGKRIGVGEYQQTAALWTRGVLEHDFAVSQYKVHWYMERTEELSHGGVTGFIPPRAFCFTAYRRRKAWRPCSSMVKSMSHRSQATSRARSILLIVRLTFAAVKVTGPMSNRFSRTKSAKRNASSLSMGLFQ